MNRFLRYTSILLVLAALFAFSSCDGLYIPVMGNTQPATEETTPKETDPPETEPPAPKKRVALTFDDGPANDDLTYLIVDKLAEHGGKATFFLVGNRINTNTGKAIKYAAEHGSEIGIHAFTHDYNFSTCAESVFLQELENTKRAIEKYSGTKVTLLRPPYGSITEERAVLSGYPIIHWSVDSEDWRNKSRDSTTTISKNVQTTVENILSQIEDGDIVLLHEIYRNSYEAVSIVIDTLAAEGYEFVTVTELIGKENLKVGKTYYSG